MLKRDLLASAAFSVLFSEQEERRFCFANVPDDLYLGQVPSRVTTANENPTANSGVGPMGRIAFLNIVPLTKETANVAALQALTNGVAMTLAAGTGTTSGLAPDGSGRTVIQFDVPRCVSLTSTSNLSGVNITVTGFDQYGEPMTQTLAGPNNTTVNTTKAFFSVVGAVPNATNAGTLSLGSADIFGLPFAISDAGFLVQVGWANALARDAGTFVAAVATNPATASTGDVRGTYAPSSGSNGTNRLVIGMHLQATQCGPSATVLGAYGVTQF